MPARTAKHVAVVAWLGLILCGGPALAQAQAPSATLEQAAARVIAAVLPDLRYPWRLDWSAFGPQSGRELRWHLTGPAPYQPFSLPYGVHRRTGWLSIGGRSSDVAVCGDAERIGALVFQIDDREGELITELAALNVRATLIERREAEPFIHENGYRAGDYYTAHLRARPALQRWRLERDGREAAELQAEWRCSHPGAAHAVSCRAIWRLVFRPEAPMPGADCPMGGR